MTDRLGCSEPVLNAALRQAVPPVQLGLHASHTWHQDPKHLLFTLARYHTVAQWIAGAGHVLEVGGGDLTGTGLVACVVQHLTVLETTCLPEAHRTPLPQHACPVVLLEHDLAQHPFADRFEAVYSLDVVEHLAPTHADRFLQHLAACTLPTGLTILGTPNASASAYQSQASRLAHRNLYTASRLKTALLAHYAQVTLLGLNDATLHLGFEAMRHYLVAVASHPKPQDSLTNAAD